MRRSSEELSIHIVKSSRVERQTFFVNVMIWHLLRVHIFHTSEHPRTTSTHTQALADLRDHLFPVCATLYVTPILPKLYHTTQPKPLLSPLISSKCRAKCASIVKKAAVDAICSTQRSDTHWQAHVCDRVDGCWAEVLPGLASQYRVALVLGAVDTVQQIPHAPPHVWTFDRFTIQHRKTGNAIQA